MPMLDPIKLGNRQQRKQPTKKKRRNKKEKIEQQQQRNNIGNILLPSDLEDEQKKGHDLLKFDSEHPAGLSQDLYPLSYTVSLSLFCALSPTSITQDTHPPTFKAPTRSRLHSYPCALPRFTAKFTSCTADGHFTVSVWVVVWVTPLAGGAFGPGQEGRLLASTVRI